MSEAKGKQLHLGIEEIYEIIFDQQKEIERLNNIINEMEQFYVDNANDEMNYYENFLIPRYRKTIEKLQAKYDLVHSIIKEVREYIKQNEFYLDYKTGACIKGVMPLLEILDKEKME